MLPATANNEPIFALPTGRLMGSVALASGLAGAAWVAVTLLRGESAAVQWTGLLGAGVVFIVGLLGIVVMAPWRARPASTWMTLWLAGTAIRMLAAPALTFLLYFAAPLNAMTLTLAVALAYLVALLTEAATIARHVSRATA